MNYPEQKPIIQVKQLSAWYGKTQALHSIDFTIVSLSVTALIGPSGCGKSTFVRCLNRMHEEIPGTRVSGDVFIDGFNIYTRSLQARYVRCHVGMVFQQPNPFPLSIFENIAYALRAQKKPRHVIQEAVEQSLRGTALWDEVKDRLNAPAHGLSGGQQQRLCIARALAVKPNILLMDEPCSALDPAATAKIEELISELREQYTVIIVTHNMQQAARVSQFTGFFLAGRLIEFGPTVDIFEHPQQKETEDYVRGRFG
jgi:phosphate transport system ATP-binding protein